MPEPTRAAQPPSTARPKRRTKTAPEPAAAPESKIASGSAAAPEPVLGRRARPAVTSATRSGEPSTTRLMLLVGGLVLALVGGFGLGRLGTGGATPSGAPAGGATTDHTHAPGTGPHQHGPDGTSALPGSAGADVSGFSLSSSGYTLVPAGTTFEAGREQAFRFHVQGADRKPVTNFAVVHDKQLHMIIARRDLTGYQHVHPTLAPDGTWTVPLTLPTPGIWRAYADFTATDADGRQSAVTLGVDLVVGGDYAARPLPTAAREAPAAPYTVTYEGTPQVGATSPLLFRVFSGGSAVTGLERYLGAYGHLVALRAGDLGYVHVHPEDQLSNGAVKFWLSAPSPGSYRMFFDFQVGGVVRTAEFTLVVP